MGFFKWLINCGQAKPTCKVSCIQVGDYYIIYIHQPHDIRITWLKGDLKHDSKRDRGYVINNIYIEADPSQPSLRIKMPESESSNIAIRQLCFTLSDKDWWELNTFIHTAFVKQYHSMPKKMK